MDIFIYGSQNFKKDVKKILNNSNIKEVLENVSILELDSIEKLKNNISLNPDSVYLIDDDKIVRKSSFKFLKSKDGIEEEFLLKAGVKDLFIENLEEIPTYILKKYDERQSNKDSLDELESSENVIPLDSELEGLLENENDLEETKNDIVGLDVQELEGLIEDKKETIKEDVFNENVGLNNISYDYDDDSILNDSGKSDEDLLNDILNSNIDDEEEFEFVGETFEDVNFLDEIFPNKVLLNEEDLKKQEERIELLKEKDTPKEEAESNFDKSEINNSEKDIVSDEDFVKMVDFDDYIDNIENSSLDDEDFSSYDEDKELIEDNKSLIDNANETFIQEEKNIQGEDMSDEFLELDSLKEEDLLAALEDNPLTDTQNVKSEDNKNNEHSLEVNGSTNINEIANLITKLLNNKTLEITIKIKD